MTVPNCGLNNVVIHPALILRTAMCISGEPQNTALCNAQTACQDAAQGAVGVIMPAVMSISASEM